MLPRREYVYHKDDLGSSRCKTWNKRSSTGLSEVPKKGKTTQSLLMLFSCRLRGTYLRIKVEGPKYYCLNGFGDLQLQHLGPCTLQETSWYPGPQTLNPRLVVQGTNRKPYLQTRKPKSTLNLACTAKLCTVMAYFMGLGHDFTCLNWLNSKTSTTRV